nr:nodulation protein [Melilotus officinalis]
MASTSNNSSSQSQRICKYDVFLSFRGPDTRNTFMDHLYHNLIKKGISVFKDDQSLRVGESISEQLIQAIQDSRVSIVVFSKRYADSSWCLDEMAAIAECRREFKQTVIPVFYDVDPSHVRKGIKHLGYKSHGEEEEEHSRRKFKYDPDRVNRWNTAMTELANLAGFDLRFREEFGEVVKIVQAVIKNLGHKFSMLTNDLVGMQPRVEELEKLLKLSSENDDFRVLGIWGMGGVGKTTHATVLYDRISYQFDACSFIDNVSKIYKDGGVVSVHKQILRQALDEKNLDTYDNCEIARIMVNRFHSGIKVLLVLDNVDQLEQLQELAIDPKLLCKGSRIIITTRDRHILSVYGADEIHEVPLLNNNDAHELLCRKAFQKEGHSSSYDELIPEVLRYAQHLPLAIKVVGSFLCTRDTIYWTDTLDRLRHNPDSKIMDVLQWSVDELHPQEREIFLHIACFFKGEREDYVKRILDACGLHPHIGIQIILEKSLITIENGEIHMHDMLQELGKEIVRRGFPEEPGSWNRLWRYDDFYHVLMTETGTNNVKAIVLDQKENVSKCRAEGFSNMRNLVLLILYHNNFSGNFSCPCNNLRYLLWHGYPFASLPSNFEPQYIVELNIPDSSIQQLWEGSKNLPNLKRMDLSNCKCLTETPIFNYTPKLERLDFTGCTNLVKVHPSIGHLTKLVFLSLQNCSSLVNLEFGRDSTLMSLRVLRLSGCTKLENTPDFTGASFLEYLDMDGCTSLCKVHESIAARLKLRFWSLRDCTNLETLPLQRASGPSSSLYLLFPRRFQPLSSLVSLDVSFCNLLEVHYAIGDIWCLERLNLQGNKFDSLPRSICKLNRLAYLNLAHCHKLQTFPRLASHVLFTSRGIYVKTSSGSRDHRSGVYIFDCPMVKSYNFVHGHDQWLEKLLVNPVQFRCGFDIIVPWERENIDHPLKWPIPDWIDHIFSGRSRIRIARSSLDTKWLGFVFCVAFEVNNLAAANSGSLSSALPHPFYLSFEGEETEERFDMQLSLELDKIDGSKHLWMIYISQEHCHFVKTGAHITFKACPGLVIKTWGLRMLNEKENPENLYANYQKFFDRFEESDLMFDYVEESFSWSGPKIQLPYNWLVTEEEEVENSQAKSKEIGLSNLGL